MSLSFLFTTTRGVLSRKFRGIVALGFGLLAMLPMAAVFASHAWGNLHWSRAANPFSMTLGDNMSANWDAHLATSAFAWSSSTVLDIAVSPGMTSVKNCKPVPGRVEACNAKYGRNGWLGIASVWASGDHITQGTVKMNDTYFSMAAYNTPEWRNLVLCQEVGHTIGLDHQDETFTNPNLGTCMDYTNSPASNQLPNQHDYEMLETIYAHLDGAASAGASSALGRNDLDMSNDMSDAHEWGREIRRSKDGRASLYERNLGDGNKIFTHVFWAEPRR